jgi:hypothetical protein
MNLEIAFMRLWRTLGSARSRVTVAANSRAAYALACQCVFAHVAGLLR